MFSTKAVKLISLAIVLLLLTITPTYATDNVGSSIHYFDGHALYRVSQGVAVYDGNIYVTTDVSDVDKNFNLDVAQTVYSEDIISVYTLDGEFLKEKRNAFTEVDSQGRFMSFGDVKVIDGFLYAPVYNKGLPPFASKVVKYSLPDLEQVQVWDIGDGMAEGIYKYMDDYWVVYHDKAVIRRFDSNFTLKKEYAVQPLLGDGGYQSIVWKDDKLYANYHGPNRNGLNYANGLDEYELVGDELQHIRTIKPPTYGSGQGFDYYGDHYYWVDRAMNRIIITDKLENNRIKTLTSPITVQDMLKPLLLNGWKEFDSTYDRSVKIWKDQSGFVHMEGLVKSGTVGFNTPIIKLPEGYRPAQTQNFAVVSNDKFGRVNIIGNHSPVSPQRSGEILLVVGSNEWVSLDGISFLAE